MKQENRPDDSKIISARQLTKSFGKFMAVENVDLDVYEGEILGLLGPNGAGKTTLISMLTGVLKPDTGQAVVCGHNLRTELSKIKRKVSLVPQDLAIYLELTAYDNLSFFANLYGLKGKLKKERIEEALEISQLHDQATKKVGNFSGGMKRRLNLAIGLLNHPKVIFFDEPTVGVDPQSRSHIFKSIQYLVKELKMSVIYTTHYMEEAELLCDRVAIYDQGKIMDLDDTEALLTKHGQKQLEIRMDPIGEEMLTEIAHDNYVDSVHYVDDKLVIHAHDLLIPTEKVLGMIREKQLQVKSFNVRESDLEDVFLKLTGKKLRN
ncbi:ABC transporter ATP-binding protein [Virgibacillus soli]|uniref:ABC transporter ATP-binding protein n=1 Tax=Paracerasibacillus soli TaxID=480284 RepID=UPI0035E8F49F